MEPIKIKVSLKSYIAVCEDRPGDVPFKYYAKINARTAADKMRTRQKYSSKNSPCGKAESCYGT